ncbi:phage tail protein [Qipengyuania sp.]|uniref:GTA baseplate fiber-binding domain-containing protein n=1 Tax=Qipengyuania sp. TaxID=2004515 RepID=UPI0035C86B30
MATIVFGALGTAIGGPLGGAIGSLLGREVDRRMLGPPSRKGPRLTELAVTSSSYGTPIARHFGAMRVAGTIIWASDFRETGTTTGGGKGAPSTTSYSYSVSLAVALSSRPIERIGRVWADGNLLRGAAGDLKTGGTLRIHTGHGDQSRDPLLAAALGERCPAHRGLAYAVFEDLQLADFGNRIPALAFEVFADGGGEGLLAALTEDIFAIRSDPLPAAASITGFSHDGGSLAAVMEAVGEAIPLVVDGAGSVLAVGPEGDGSQALRTGAPIAWADGEFGTRTGTRRDRAGEAGPTTLRYYDTGRDYQPGMQRVTGSPAGIAERTLELPAALDAGGARAMIGALHQRERMARDRFSLRLSTIDLRMRPGAAVRVSGAPGLWRIESWEWRDGGIELALARAVEGVVSQGAAADSGAAWAPRDRLAGDTRLDAFELPWDGSGSPDVARIHVAAGSTGGRWAGAELFAERAGALVSLGGTGPVRAVAGVLAAPLAGSPALVFEPAASLEVMADDPDSVFPAGDLLGILGGSNRLLVGSEIVQFAGAQPLGEGRWRLTGLLRGRGGTEAEACEGHSAGARIVLLDSRLRLFGDDAIDPTSERLAAIGLGETDPVFASVTTPGRSRRPLSPVHARVAAEDGQLALSWTRRARGAWTWGDVSPPLVEESESYEVGAGDPAEPLRSWESGTTRLTLPTADLDALPPGTPLWVRQRGTFARSDPTLLTILD